MRAEGQDLEWRTIGSDLAAQGAARNPHPSPLSTGIVDGAVWPAPNDVFDDYSQHSPDSRAGEDSTCMTARHATLAVHRDVRISRGAADQRPADRADYAVLDSVRRTDCPSFRIATAG